MIFNCALSTAFLWASSATEARTRFRLPVSEESESLSSSDDCLWRESGTPHTHNTQR